MKINKVLIKNMGPFKELATFDFSVERTRNIILIGGKNGAGKTTLLKCIKYGMFGSYSMGLKNNAKTYNDEILKMMNNNSSSKDDFYITLDFEYYENYTKFNYSLKRSWNLINNELLEEVSVKDIENSKFLSMEDTVEVVDKLRSLSSPELINSFIFDGEEVSDVISSGNMSDYLQKTFYSVFNINLLEQLDKDLINYMSKRENIINSPKEREAIDLLSKINDLKNKQKNIDVLLKEKNKRLVDLIITKKDLRKKFYTLGGLTKNEQKKYQEEISYLQKRKEKSQRKYREILENDLSLIMCIPIIKSALIQAEKEIPLTYIENLCQIEKFINVDLSPYKNIISESTNKIKLIQKISNEEIMEIQNRVSKILDSKKYVNSYLKSSISNSVEYNVLKHRVFNSESIQKLELLNNEMYKLSVSISFLEDEINIIIHERKNLIEQIENLNLSYMSLNDILKKDSLTDNSYLVSNKCLDVEAVFRKTLIRNKTKKVSQFATEIFIDTIRKNNYVSKILIDESFELYLFGNDMKKIDPKILSAGELQILIASLIWAMFKVSKRKEMFIFDTPLARLDKENRLNFINNIIKTISKQVVVLSTDSEFIGDNHKVLEEVISKSYLLSYEEDSASSTVVDSYFVGEKNER